MSPLHSLRIIIPACNEQDRIEPTVREYCSVFRDSATILIVANGCTDGTVQTVKQLQGQYDNLQLLEIAARIGKGGAVRAGLWTGSEDYVGFVDADGSTPANEFARLFAILNASHNDGVIGSRWLPGARIEQQQPLARRFASRAFNMLVRWLFGLRYADTQCGAKLFRRSAIDQIAHSLELANFAFDIEVLWRLKRSHLAVHEEPTTWSDKQEGTSIRLASSSWGMLKSILRLRLRESSLWLLPFIDRFGRTSVIPVVRQSRVLLVGDCLTRLRERDGRFASLIVALDAANVRLSDVEGEVRSRWLRRLCMREDFIGTAATLCWYVLSSRRDHDAIVEVAQPRLSWIPAFSLKPSLLVATSANPILSSHRSRYARTAVLKLDDVDTSQAAEVIAAMQTGATRYAGMFFGQQNSIALHCPSDSGLQRHYLHH